MKTGGELEMERLYEKELEENYQRELEHQEELEICEGNSDERSRYGGY